ncbi:hypothetical protein HCU01_19270 [Halomonas cupida]|uniref:Integrase n=1 Tax=Halomonas cupida TaxID=44933 RepID=A0ABQ0WH98_9GAMM|nr:hypothetical protein HCU01_19270 [Halomonas cupida]
MIWSLCVRDIVHGDRVLPGAVVMQQKTQRQSTVRYLGIEVDDALEMAGQTEA